LNTTYEALTLFEHRFWLQILGDHGRFIRDELSPIEKEEIQRAEIFIKIFDELLAKSHQPLTSIELEELTIQAHHYAEEIRSFKLDIIRKHLVKEINIGLPPTFLNHMVNEVEEYIRILNCLIERQIPTAHPLHHHMIWLIDAAGHANAIACSLDDVEHKLIEESKEFSEDFEKFYIKAIEMTGYMRTNLDRFPALTHFNKQAELGILLFMKFLQSIKELELNNQVLGTLSYLLPDHMFREECYYLTKLAQVSEVKQPDCDPTIPRKIK